MPVPALVVAGGYLGGELQKRRTGASEDVAADFRMRLHLAIFGFRQTALLEKNRVGHRDLADVVHRGRQPDIVADMARQTQLDRDRFRIGSNAQRVTGRFRVLVFGGERQAMDDLLLALAQFTHGTLNLAPQPFGLIGELAASP